MQIWNFSWQSFINWKGVQWSTWLKPPPEIDFATNWWCLWTWISPRRAETCFPITVKRKIPSFLALLTAPSGITNVFFLQNCFDSRYSPISGLTWSCTKNQGNFVPREEWEGWTIAACRTAILTARWVKYLWKFWHFLKKGDKQSLRRGSLQQCYRWCILGPLRVGLFVSFDS